jgi:hypothetical protein
MSTSQGAESTRMGTFESSHARLVLEMCLLLTPSRVGRERLYPGPHASSWTFTESATA